MSGNRDTAAFDAITAQRLARKAAEVNALEIERDAALLRIAELERQIAENDCDCWGPV